MERGSIWKPTIAPETDIKLQKKLQKEAQSQNVSPPPSLLAGNGLRVSKGEEENGRDD
jgi:hypothetical protein